MPDRGHELTDELLKDLEERIGEEYARASRDMQRKLREYMEQFSAGMEQQKKLLDAGEITQTEYNNWVYRHTMMGKRWEAMRDTLAADMEHANEIALRIADEKMADVYCLNADFATYEIEHGGRLMEDCELVFVQKSGDKFVALVRTHDKQYVDETADSVGRHQAQQPQNNQDDGNRI